MSYSINILSLLMLMMPMAVLPCYAGHKHKVVALPVIDIIPLSAVGPNDFTIVTIANHCSSVAVGKLLLYTKEGLLRFNTPVFILPNSGWTHRYDGSFPETLWGEFVQNSTDCPARTFSEIDHLDGQHVSTLVRDAFELHSGAIDTGLFNNSTDIHDGVLVANVLNTPGIVSICTAPSPDYTQCSAWKDVTIPPFGLRLVAGPGLQIYNKRRLA